MGDSFQGNKSPVVCLVIIILLFHEKFTWWKQVKTCGNNWNLLRINCGEKWKLIYFIPVPLLTVCI